MSIFEVTLAFLEGAALIASPCILPVLPLVLGASLEGGKRRPYGIILGFILAFSAFAMLSAKLVSLLGVNLDLIKNLSLILLAALAIVLISSSLSRKFGLLTQGLADLGSQIATGSDRQNDFISGIVIGSLIGLVWTPCAGPIMAAVLVEVIRQQSNLGSAVIIIAFASGASLPMLLIVIIGKEITAKMSFFLKHADGVRKVLGVLILFAVAWIAFGDKLPLIKRQPIDQLDTHNSGLIRPLKEQYDAPEFAPNEMWINSPALKMKDLRGKVVLVDFWTYSCINCIRTLPYLISWDEKYRQDGLVIVGVHAPEFEFEKNLNNVKNAVEKNHIQYPVVLDNMLSTWNSFHNLYWPAHYLINRNGQVVYTHFGEGDYEATEHNIRFLLNIHDHQALTKDNQAYYSQFQTPETYLGYLRMNNLANETPLWQDGVSEYHFPNYLPTHHWALDGKWMISPEKAITDTGPTALRLHFNAKQVFLVMGTASPNSIKVTLLLNGKPIAANAGKDASAGKIVVNQHALYELVNQSKAMNGLLEIQINSPGLEVYAFTFGSD